MRETWRLLDTGGRSAAENMALDAVLLEGKEKGLIPNTLHFLQFSPPAALVGYHQSIEQEIRLDYCQERGIEVNRRLTGGGAIYLDNAQLGWGLVCGRADLKAGSTLSALAEKIGQGVAVGIRRLGVEARFRPRNDIEVNGRKISGTGGAFSGEALLYQGTLLIDLDLETMAAALKITPKKLAARELQSIRERLTCLKTELGITPGLAAAREALQEGLAEALQIHFAEGELTPWERASWEERLEEFRSEEWIHASRDLPGEVRWLQGTYRSPAGTIQVALQTDVERAVLKQLLLTGDFFLHPQRTILDLEAWLRNTPLAALEENLQRFFADRTPDMLGLEAGDFLQAIDQTLNEVKQA
ncbi:MAG: lipoate--protein ligase family protein [Candidatus Tectomicrobia bacterium]|uniref:Lipoate--protein ligase family protein n=1 Tax=Tectimicrobiota bacterium TaxID=2528274 RepID=A0A932CME8_UNCTE|nr:lipoate--protein ligase family protein [Candidatus Tectomicrobia bacterium]